MKCPKCNFVNQAGSKFCSHCGTSLANVCARCSTKNIPMDAKFCPNCGTLLKEEKEVPKTSTCTNVISDKKGIGKFSISPTKQVTFSRGNLRYNRKMNIWSFAENQYDCLGSTNMQENTLGDIIDLFGWGLGNVHGTEDDVFFSDWGQHKIGSNPTYLWRTLSNQEWRYLIEERRNAKSLIGIAQVAGVNGLILLPDNWMNNEVNFVPGGHYSNDKMGFAFHQDYSKDQWMKMQDKGAVFLPAAGFCERINLEKFQERGYYWTSTPLRQPYGSIYFSFSPNFIDTYHGIPRTARCSVRLVKNI